MTVVSSRLAEPRLRVLLGGPDDRGAVPGLAAAAEWLLAIHHGAAGRGRLRVLDAGSLEPVTDPLPVGPWPRRVAWHPGRRAAFVLSCGPRGAVLSRCVPDSGEVIDIALRGRPTGLAVDPDADLVHLIEPRTRRLHLIEAGDLGRRHTVALPAVPLEVAIGLPGDPVLVTLAPGPASAADTLAAVAPDGSIELHPLGPEPLGPGPLAVGHDGLVHLGAAGTLDGDRPHPVLAVHAPESGARLGAATTAAPVRALAAHPHLARVWAATDRGAQLIDTSNPHVPVPFETITTGPHPAAVAVAADGAVYVGDGQDGTVTLIQPDPVELPPEVLSGLLAAAGHPTTAGLGGSLRSYQCFHGLPMTARPDPTTVEHLIAPGCGTPDLPAAEPVATGPRWRHTTLTYYLGDLRLPRARRGFTGELADRLFRAAFDEWNAILSERARPFEITRVPDPALADIVLTAGEDAAFRTPGRVGAVHAVTRPGPPALIVVNPALVWDAPGLLGPAGSGVDFRQVVTHQLGHALGLQHLRRDDTVMHRNARRRRVPHPADRAAVRASYGRMPYTSAVGIQVRPGQSHVICQDCEQHLLVHHPTGDGGWSSTRLTDFGAPRVARGDGISAFHARDGVPCYLYRGAGDHVHQLWFADGDWWRVDLNDDSGGAPPAAVAPHGYRNGDAQRVVYATADGRIIRLSRAPGEAWSWEDLGPSGGGLAGSVFGYVDHGGSDPSGRQEVVAVTDRDGGLRLLRGSGSGRSGGGWRRLALIEVTAAPHPVPLAAAPIWGMAQPGEPHRLFALDRRGHVRMFDSDGGWHDRSLTVELGLPAARSVAGQRVFSVDAVAWAWVLVCADVEGRLWELTSCGEGCWTAGRIDAGDPVPVGPHPVSVWLGDTERHIGYTGTDGNVHLLSRPIGDVGPARWDRRNLTRDAGVV
jgi:hypothetical protein